jgi:hypothetical protein
LAKRGTDFDGRPRRVIAAKVIRAAAPIGLAAESINDDADRPAFGAEDRLVRRHDPVGIIQEIPSVLQPRLA